MRVATAPETHLTQDVILYGVTVADPDIRSDDLLELVVSAEEDGPGDLAFAGLRGKRLQRRMRLEELNQAGKSEEKRSCKSEEETCGS